MLPSLNAAPRIRPSATPRRVPGLESLRKKRQRRTQERQRTYCASTMAVAYSPSFVRETNSSVTPASSSACARRSLGTTCGHLDRAEVENCGIGQVRDRFVHRLFHGKAPRVVRRRIMSLRRFCALGIRERTLEKRALFAGKTRASRTHPRNLHRVYANPLDHPAKPPNNIFCRQSARNASERTLLSPKSPITPASDPFAAHPVRGIDANPLSPIPSAAPWRELCHPGRS